MIWTDLRPGFIDITGWTFNLDHALKYLKSLEGKAFERAKEYILKAPEQTTTQYRPALQQFLLE